jgi:monoterpene epsilon-lactone hydrolase
MTVIPWDRQESTARVAIEYVPQAGIALGVAERLRVLGNRIWQIASDASLARHVHLVEQGGEPLRRAVDRLRDNYLRIDRPVGILARVDAHPWTGPLSPPSPAPIPGAWFQPSEGERRGFVFYVHGGSFVCEKSPRVTRMIAKLAAAAGARVFSPDYRLAPEYPCPAGVEDVAEAFAWLSKVYPDEPIVAVAESSGAAILLSALNLLRDRGAPMPAGVLLFSPWVDLSLQSWSVAASSMKASTPYSMASLAVMARLYLQGQSALDPVASPLFGDLSGLPPMLVHASQADIVFDDAKRLAQAVEAAGGDLTLRIWRGQTHVWERTENAEAKRSLDLAATFITARLEGRQAAIPDA